VETTHCFVGRFGGEKKERRRGVVRNGKKRGWVLAKTFFTREKKKAGKLRGERGEVFLKLFIESRKEKGNVRLNDQRSREEKGPVFTRFTLIFRRWSGRKKGGEVRKDSDR